MKKLIFCGTLFLLLIAATQSNAEMKMTPSGITFPDNSTQATAASGGGVSIPLNLTGSITTGDLINAPDGAVISGVNTYSSSFKTYGGYFTAAGANGVGVFGKASAYSASGVYGEANGTIGSGVYGRAYGNSGKGVTGFASNTGNVTNYGGYFTASGTNGRGIIGGATNSNGTGVYGVGGKWDFYAASPGGNYGPFTGAHEVVFAKDMREEMISGMIVSVTGKTETRKDKNGVISLSSTLPTVTISTKAKDKAVYGVIVSKGPLSEDHWYEAKAGERFGVVNALGEGRVWVTDINGGIQAGDYITTSSVPGYGQIQDDDLLHSYTLGKAIETVDWDQVAETVQHEGNSYKRYLIAVVYTSG